MTETSFGELKPGNIVLFSGQLHCVLGVTAEAISLIDNASMKTSKIDIYFCRPGERHAGMFSRNNDEPFLVSLDSVVIGVSCDYRWNVV